jgi:hypothetical protein
MTRWASDSPSWPRGDDLRGRPQDCAGRALRRECGGGWHGDGVRALDNAFKSGHDFTEPFHSWFLSCGDFADVIPKLLK